MLVPLPNLDDRRWADLAEEGRGLVPLYAPEWTDHNVHDPGVTLVELFAWFAEMDLYELNRIPERHKRKFLALAGIRRQPALAARAFLAFSLPAGSPPQPLPAGLEVAGEDSFGVTTRLRTLEPFTVSPAQLRRVQLRDAKGYHDLSALREKGQLLEIFGASPAVANEFYLGFSEALPPGQPVQIVFAFSGEAAGAGTRGLLLAEAHARQQACRPAMNPCACLPAGPEDTLLPPHHSVRTVWEVWRSPGTWQTLHPGEVEDDTRSLTLHGRVRFRLPAAMAQVQIGKAPEPLFYLRCRLVAGAYDAAPVVAKILVNAVAAEQALPVAQGWAIAPGVTAGGSAPVRGEEASFELELDGAGRIVKLTFGATDPAAPRFPVLQYQSATSKAEGKLIVEAAFLGRGTGAPGEELALPELVPDEETFQLYTLHDASWRAWSRRADFDSSRPTDTHFCFNSQGTAVVFGDGEQGRTLPRGSLVLAAYRSTRAADGNLESGRVNKLAASLHNQAVPAWSDLERAKLQVTNAWPEREGTSAETLDETVARMIATLGRAERAITLQDYEALAARVPGVRLARVAALANHHPGFPGFKAPGIVTIVIVPFLPAGQPAPGPELRQAVAAYLHPRRILGTRVEVVGPGYVEVSVAATVRALPGVSKASVRQKIVDVLNRFLDPLLGGPEGDGWPFGRHVYRAEILQAVDEVPGVDHVELLSLSAGGSAQCGNICVPPSSLVHPGAHAIQVA
jgi:predicted phage baseplate assembly protein